MDNNKAVFTLYEDKYVLLHIEENELKHIYAYTSLGEITPGTIINCVIEHGADNINACFVKYTRSLTGFINKKYKNGSIIPLAYKKEAVGDKKPVFTDILTIEGEYAVVSSGGKYTRVSSKIPESARQQMVEEFKPLSDKYGVGIIIRTKAYKDTGGSRKAAEEIGTIAHRLLSIRERAEHTTAYTVLYRPLPDFIRDILYLTGEGVNEVVTDIPAVGEALDKPYESATGTVNVTDRVGLRFYEDDLVSLSKLYSCEAKISACILRKVYLKSGAYITFDVTEALTAVDVNSASFDKGEDREETFLRINLEAATEIARQLILRNIGGIIIIDFINMSDARSYEALRDHILLLAGADREQCRFIDFTPLSLCELTRSRCGKPLFNILRGR